MQSTEQNTLLKPEQFVYWLQGFCEINGAPPNAEQWTIIKEHLELCFDKITVNEFLRQSPRPFIPEPFDGLNIQPYKTPVMFC